MKAAQGIWRGWIWRVVWEASRPWGCTYKGKLVRVGLIRMEPMSGPLGVATPLLLVLGPLGVALGRIHPAKREASA